MWSKRQQTASAIAAQLRTFEPTVWVLSPLPLADDSNLRFQVTNESRDAVLTKLGQWGYSVRPQGELPRVTFAGFLPATVYEISLPPERQPIPDDSRIAVPQDENIKEVREFRKLWHS